MKEIIYMRQTIRLNDMKKIGKGQSTKGDITIRERELPTVAPKSSSSSISTTDSGRIEVHKVKG